jgi:hypothetical protein
MGSASRTPPRRASDRSKCLLRVVAIGGGTGLATLLKGLKGYTPVPGYEFSKRSFEVTITNLSAVVTVTDDGGSSGRLRKELNMLPTGTSAIASLHFPRTKLCCRSCFATASRRDPDLRDIASAIFSSRP